MMYKVLGLMSGSSLDGLDMAFCEFEEAGGRWTYTISAAACREYSLEWKERLTGAIQLNARDYQLLHSDYGHYIGKQVNAFMEEYNLHYRIGFISSHGHTTFHMPPQMTGQLGCGAAIAAETELPVISDLRAMDLAYGGQGAPIVPMGEKWLLPEYQYFLNIGGIANISANRPESYAAFDCCPANRVLNMLVAERGLEYDAGGGIASGGKVDFSLLEKLNAFSYYDKAYPKSLANDFGTDTIYPLIRQSGISIPDALRTCVEHIAQQIRKSLIMILARNNEQNAAGATMLITGGGAFNTYLVNRITELLEPLNLKTEVADERLANYKEAMIMGFLGVLRWREESTVISSVTGARKDSIGGALWMTGGR
jgi:anhydro-N-acetylmuramic acid kinase